MTLAVLVTFKYINECNGKNVRRHKLSKATSLNVISRTDAKKHSRKTMPKLVTEQKRKFSRMFIVFFGFGYV